MRTFKAIKQGHEGYRYYVCDEYTYDCGPFISRSYYRLDIASWADFTHLDGQQARHDGPGYYIENQFFRAIDGGQTLPDPSMTEYARIPKPKSKLNLEWHNGSWCRLTKKGWSSYGKTPKLEWTKNRPVELDER